MRYPASEKLEIIRTVEGSHLPTKQTLDMLGIPRSTFYRWYDLHLEDGLDGLSDKSTSPKSVWNRIPDDRRDDLIEFALEHEALTARELAVKYTDEKRYYVSESSAYRILKEADLITAPDYVVIKAAEEFKDKTTAINQMWQTDFTYFKIIGWGWYYLSTILDDYSRYIISWKLCTTMRAKDVTDTIELALATSGCDPAVVQHKPRLLSDNGSCYISSELADWLEEQKWIMFAVRRSSRKLRVVEEIVAPVGLRKLAQRALAQTMKNRVLLENYYLPAILNVRSGHSSSITTTSVTMKVWATSHQRMSTLGETKPSSEKGKDQETDNQKPPLATSKTSCIIKPNVNQSLHASHSNRVPFYITTYRHRSI